MPLPKLAGKDGLLARQAERGRLRDSRHSPGLARVYRSGKGADMADVPPMVLEFAVPAAAGLLYALIWYVTRGLPRFAKVAGTRPSAPRHRAGGALRLARNAHTARTGVAKPAHGLAWRWRNACPLKRARGKTEGARATEPPRRLPPVPGRDTRSAASSAPCSHAPWRCAAASAAAIASTQGELEGCDREREGRTAAWRARGRTNRLGCRAGVLRHGPCAHGRAQTHRLHV